ncbi:MAG: hypothetical protein IJL54_14380 [Prevotella sp.]|nr:hypothetical protein [Prevotella sp.]
MTDTLDIGGRGKFDGFIPFTAGSEVFRIALGEQMCFPSLNLVNDDLEVVLDDE